VHYVRFGTPIYLVDPKSISLGYDNFVQIQEPATTGMERLKEILISK